jgi:hypothetical protein
MSTAYCWNDMDSTNCTAWRKSSLSATLSTINTEWNNPRSNTGIVGTDPQIFPSLYSLIYTPTQFAAIFNWYKKRIALAHSDKSVFLYEPYVEGTDEDYLKINDKPKERYRNWQLSNTLKRYLFTNIKLFSGTLLLVTFQSLLVTWYTNRFNVQ